MRFSQFADGTDTTNNNPVKGTPLNPHNPHYYTGGSSGGSAYAVAAGLLPVTMGADGGGSIRNPAACMSNIPFSGLILSSEACLGILARQTCLRAHLSFSKKKH